MSFVEKRNEFRPSSGEAPFALNEVFFSRTDPRGTIQAANYVFHRVAHYDWADMLGAPHRIIRHPDMPRAIFWLLWNTIQDGRPIGAYVKNRASDGLHYWVFAVVSPLRDGSGYISARIKPTSPLRARIEAEYAALRQAENEQGLSPEDSARRLLARLAEMGFPDYDRFAAHALEQELLARDTGLGQPPDKRIQSFGRMIEAAEALRDETSALVDDFERMRTVPHNMRVIASRLEPTGGPVSTLSKNYGAVSREMSDWFADHVIGDDASFATILGSISRFTLLEGMARILAECEVQLSLERRDLGGLDHDDESARLSAEVAEYRRQSAEGLARVHEEAQRILTNCDTMNRHVLGLSSTRVLCKIESARMPEAGASLADIITQLGTFQDRISGKLERIAAQSGQILALLR